MTQDILLNISIHFIILNLKMHTDLTKHIILKSIVLFFQSKIII
jgi:hypothetical protein